MIVTINGINDSAQRTTDRIADYLSRDGHDVLRGRYPVTRWWNARSRGRQYANAVRIFNQVQDHSKHPPALDVVAHSNGCLVAARMMELGVCFRYVFLFAPALDREWSWPVAAFHKCFVIYNPNDRAVFLARFAPLSHPWGDMGRRGWRSPEVEIKGWVPDVENICDEARHYPRSHSHYFKGDNLNRWGAFVSDRVNEKSAPAIGL